MKRTGFLFLMFAAISAISCLKEEVPQTQDQGMYFTFEAAREALSTPDAQQTPAVQQVATKTVLVDNNKVEWVKKYLDDVFHKRLIITHRKDLLIGDYLIDDRAKNSASEFNGEWIKFGSQEYPDWESVLKYLLM